MSYTYEQVLAYEVARELANSHIADYSAEIWEEKHKGAPDASRITELHAASQAVFLEREALSMTDDEAVARFTEKYRRRQA